MKKIACLVTNDLHQDQRMNRICSALVKAGYAVTLVGRKRKSSTELSPKPFSCVRLNCWFESSFLFYAEYNIRLFFYLISHQFDIINANDLDTILPAIWAGNIKKSKVVYDAHEYFTEQEEVVNRPTVKKIWKKIERYGIPKVSAAYTVSNGYANLFQQEYNREFKVVANATVLADQPKKSDKSKPYILYQGAVNYGRGLEQLIEAMKEVNCQLVICGDGDILDELKQKTKELNLDHTIEFKGFVEPEKLREITYGATIGLTLFANDGLSHWFSLANRFFDYMHAGVPQIAMEYPEYIEFNKKDEVAILIKNIEPVNISKALNELLQNTDLYAKISENCLRAKMHANWQTQEKVLLNVYQNLNGN